MASSHFYKNLGRASFFIAFFPSFFHLPLFLFKYNGCYSSHTLRQCVLSASTMVSCLVSTTIPSICETHAIPLHDSTSKLVVETSSPLSPHCHRTRLTKRSTFPMCTRRIEYVCFLVSGF